MCASLYQLDIPKKQQQQQQQQQQQHKDINKQLYTDTPQLCERVLQH